MYISYGRVALVACAQSAPSLRLRVHRREALRREMRLYVVPVRHVRGAPAGHKRRPGRLPQPANCCQCPSSHGHERVRWMHTSNPRGDITRVHDVYFMCRTPGRGSVPLTEHLPGMIYQVSETPSTRHLEPRNKEQQQNVCVHARTCCSPLHSPTPPPPFLLTHRSLVESVYPPSNIANYENNVPFLGRPPCPPTSPCARIVGAFHDDDDDIYDIRRARRHRYRVMGSTPSWPFSRAAPWGSPREPLS